jgi:hypothetical protein
MINIWKMLPLAVILTTVAAVGLAGCATGVPEPVRDLEQRVEASRARGAALDASYREMPLAELVAQLQADSAQGLEPFNSRAYQEAVRRGAEIGRALATSMDSSDRRQVLTLLALRESSREAYSEIEPAKRVQILVDDLERSKFYNRWGIPHLYWEDAGRALIEQGQTALPALRELLDDDRPAPVWGDEEATISREFGYRVKDYAWALIQAIQGRGLADIPRDAAGRDRLIRATVP